jgi:transcriptional antiterminator RfaH
MLWEQCQASFALVRGLRLPLRLSSQHGARIPTFDFPRDRSVNLVGPVSLEPRARRLDSKFLAAIGCAMPILAAEPSLYPDNLLDDLAITDGERRWWVAYTHARQEKALARQLHALGVPFYLPLVPKVSMIRGRRVKSLLPLFSSYVFLFAHDRERIEASATRRVAHLFAPSNAQSITRDLRYVRSLIESGAPLTVEARLQPGQRVRVKHGALLDIEGVIVSRRGGERLLVAVEFLQQGVSIEIDDFQLEPI